MNIIQIKNGLHSMIEQIDNPSVLEDYFLEMKKIVDSGKEGVWHTLSEEQQEEVLMAWSESENPENLIDNDKIFEKYQKWLSK